MPNRSDLTRTIGDRTLACCRMSSPRTYSLFTMTNSVTHRRALRQSAKPDKFRVSGGARRDRTDDLKLAKLPLSQLSYGPILEKGHAPMGAAAGRPCGLVVRHAWQSLVGLGGLEPPTSRLSSARSNQLSYKPLAELSKSPQIRSEAPQARLRVAAYAAPSRSASTRRVRYGA